MVWRGDGGEGWDDDGQMELLSRGVDGPDSSFVCGCCVRQLRALEKTLKTVTFMLDAAVHRKKSEGDD